MGTACRVLSLLKTTPRSQQSKGRYARQRISGRGATTISGVGDGQTVYKCAQWVGVESECHASGGWREVR